MNPRSVERAVVGTALRQSLINMPSAKLRQLSQWSLNGTFTSADGRVDFGRRAAAEIYPLIADWVGDTLAAVA